MAKDLRYVWFQRKIKSAYPGLWPHVHVDCQEAIFNYLLHGYEPGGFLVAVLVNDLYAAACKADFVNVEHLGYVAKFVVQALPTMCYGSAERVRNWSTMDQEERERVLVSAGMIPDTFQLIKLAGEKFASTPDF